MRRSILILSAAAICVMASGQAEAKYSVIKWKSGFCQVWDSAFPAKPPASEYKAVSRSYKTFDKAMAKRNKLVAKKACM
jgi:hypothetical protein